jgi:hypothetical protein
MLIYPAIWFISNTTLRNQTRLKKFSNGYVVGGLISELIINLKGHENICRALFWRKPVNYVSDKGIKYVWQPYSNKRA